MCVNSTRDAVKERSGQSEAWNERQDELEEDKDGLSMLSNFGGGWEYGAL